MENDIKNLTINENHKFITYDIKDFFVNIPVDEVLNSTRTLLKLRNSKPQLIHRVLYLMKSILSYN